MFKIPSKWCVFAEHTFSMGLKTAIELSNETLHLRTEENKIINANTNRLILRCGSLTLNRNNNASDYRNKIECTNYFLKLNGK